MDELQKALARHIHTELLSQDPLGAVDDFNEETCWVNYIDVGSINLALIASSILTFIDGWRQHHG